MKVKYKNILKSEVLGNSAKLLSANVIAQVIGLIIYPVITRLYAPADFGLFNLFNSIAAVLIIMATMEYQYAIVLPTSQDRARGVFHMGFLLLCSVTLFVVLTIPFARPIASLFKAPELVKFYCMLPGYVFLMGLWNLLNYWYIRQKQYTRISGYQLSQSILSAGTRIGFGYGGILQGGLIFSSIISPLLSLVISISLAWKKNIKSLLSFSWDETKMAAKEYRNFPLYTFPRSIINIVACQLPVLIFTPVFGAANVGIWGMASLLGLTPINTITKSVYQVLYQHITERVQQHLKIEPLFRKYVLGVLAIAVPGLILLYFVLPWLTTWLLGAQWSQTGHLLRLMLPWVLMMLITSSTCFLSDVFMKQKIGFWFEVLLAVCRIGGLMIGVWQKDFVMAVAGYSFGSTIVILAQFLWLYSLVRKYDHEISE